MCHVADSARCGVYKAASTIQGAKRATRPKTTAEPFRSRAWRLSRQDLERPLHDRLEEVRSRLQSDLFAVLGHDAGRAIRFRQVASVSRPADTSGRRLPHQVPSGWKNARRPYHRRTNFGSFYASRMRRCSSNGTERRLPVTEGFGRRFDFPRSRGRGSEAQVARRRSFGAARDGPFFRPALGRTAAVLRIR